MNFDLNFKVLAYPAAKFSSKDHVSPCLCSLVFQCDAAKEATLLLVVTIPTAHDTETQFVLQYDADKLDSSGVKLVNGSESVTQAHLDEIPYIKGASNKKKRLDIKTLHLTTTDAPPLWCAAATPSFSPRPGNELAFQQFVDLAKARSIRVVFDLPGNRHVHRGMFKAFSKAAKHLKGYPVEDLLIKQSLRKASWEIFAPSETTGAPPAYEGKGKGPRTRKRSRQASSSSPEQPSRRLTRQSPVTCCSDHEYSPQSHSSDKTIPFTAEEEADSLRRALGFGHQAELISAAIKKQLSAHLDEAVNAAVTRQLPAYFTEGLHTAAVDASVNTQLRPILQAILPKAVEALFVPTPPGSPALPFTSFDSSGHRYPALPPLSPLGEMLLPHLHTHLTAQVCLQQEETLQRFEKLARKTFDKLEESAFEDRARAHAEFEDDMEGLKADVLLLTKDAVDEVWREGQKLIDQGKEECAVFGEDVDHHLHKIIDKIDTTMGGNGLRKLVAREVRRQDKGRKKSVPKRKTISRSNVRKAKEKEDVRGKHRLLGRQRVEEEEWEDV